MTAEVSNLASLEKENDAYLKQDASKLRMLNELTLAFSKTEIDKSIMFAQQAIDLAERLKLPLELAQALRRKSAAQKIKGEMESAIDLAEKSYSIYKNEGDEQGAALTLVELGDIFRMRSDLIKSKEHLEHALELFHKLQDLSGMGSAYALLGNVFLLTSDFSKSTDYYIKAIDIFTQTGEEERLAGTLSNLGGVFYFTGDYPKALEQFQKALTINEKSGNKLWILANHGNSGNIYFEMGEYQKALQHFLQTLEIANELDNKHSINSSLGNIGNVYLSLSEETKAMEYYQRALNISNEIGDKGEIASGLINIGKIYIIESRYEEALENFNKCLSISEEIGRPEITLISFICLGKWYMSASDIILHKIGFNPDEKYDKALDYIQKSLKISREINMLKEEKEGLEILSELYELQCNFKESLKAYKKFIDIRDKIHGEESKKQVTRKEMQYEFDKKVSLAKAEQEKKDALVLKEIQRQKLLRNSFIGGFTTVLLFAGVFFKQRNKIKKGKELSDKLLLNILPEQVAEELKAKGSAEAKHFDKVTVMFTDFKGFTKISENLSPTELVAEIDSCFKTFDSIISKYNIEKIKTIGDSYMCAGGLPVENRTNAHDIVNAAIEIQKYMNKHLQQRKKEGKEIFEIRIGIHTGPVVAGIVGVKKFAYDIWGNTVNIASRMESSGEPGMINISGSTYELVKDKFNCRHRGKIEAKNIGEIDMYFVDN